ncbi:MAG: type IV pilus assembly protein PilM [Gaiellaceae bacterium]
MDFNKEIKLSDLVRRPKKKAKATGATKPSSTKRKRHRKQEIVGLKIGASQIAASRVVNNGGPAKLVQLARVPLEPGVVVGGEVRNIAALATALDRFFTENKLPRRGIRLGIGTNRIGVRSIEIEGIEDERQLGNAVRFRAHEALSIPPDQAVLDYHTVSETVSDSGAVSRRVLLAASYKEPIDHYVDACRGARLELSSIDVEAFALLRAVAPQGEDGSDDKPAAASVVVSIGHDRSTLAISDGTVCDFMRVLDWGGAKLEAAVARELGLTGAEAAELKLELDLGGDAAADDDPRVARARAAVGRELQTLARELVSSLQFYQAQPGSLAISEVRITGGTTRLPGLADELERLTRVPVRVGDPLAAVHVSNGLADRDDLASFAVAIGLGVER